MTAPDDKVRIDKWLWAARFFKTRALAQAAVVGGKVHLNGDRVKPSRIVEVQDRLEITRGEQHFEVHVLAVSDKRGPADVARQLYAETQASRERREAQGAMQKALRQSAPRPEGKPDKKQRRKLIRFKTRD